MTLRRAAMVLVLALPSCAAPRSPGAPVTATGFNADPCAVTASFGSFAMGIDRKAALRAEQAIAADPGVTAVSRTPAGREGEYELCVDTASRLAAIDLYEKLRRALAGPVRAPVTITGPARRYSPPVGRGR